MDSTTRDVVESRTNRGGDACVAWVTYQWLRTQLRLSFHPSNPIYRSHRILDARFPTPTRTSIPPSMFLCICIHPHIHFHVHTYLSTPLPTLSTTSLPPSLHKHTPNSKGKGKGHFPSHGKEIHSVRNLPSHAFVPARPSHHHPLKQPRRSRSSSRSRSRCGGRSLR